MQHRAFSHPLVALLLLPLSLSAEDPPTPEESALSVVQSYVAKLKAKNTTAALLQHWNFEALCDGIFGQAFVELSKEERLRTARMFVGILSPSMSDPRVAEGLATAKYERFEAELKETGEVEVRFTVTLPFEGAKPTQQSMFLKQLDSRYRVVDVRNGAGSPRLTEKMAANYARYSEKLTPVEYADMLLKSMKKEEPATVNRRPVGSVILQLMADFDTAFPPLLSQLHALEFDYNDGEGVDFEPWSQFQSASENTAWIRAWSGNSELDASEYRFFGQDGTGGLAGFWLVHEGADTLQQPVVFFGSEGEAGVVAVDFFDYLWVLASGVGPLEAVEYGPGDCESPDFLAFASEHAGEAQKTAGAALARAKRVFPTFCADVAAKCR